MNKEMKMETVLDVDRLNRQETLYKKNLKAMAIIIKKRR